MHETRVVATSCALRAPKDKNRHVAQRRDFVGLEQRRMKAARMFAKGKRQADVAAELGVSRQTASDWHAKWRSGGKQALKAAGRVGRLPKLDDAALKAVEKALLDGPKANGFPTELWTLPRVADVIEEVTAVRFSDAHVWKVLKAMGWSRQRPARRAAERDDEALERWVKNDWPRIKRGPEGEVRGSSSKTRAASR